MVAIARQALADRAVFGAEVDPARDQIATLDRAAESASRDVLLHEAALEAYDPSSLRTGVVLLCVAAVLAAGAPRRADRVACDARHRGASAAPLDAALTASPQLERSERAD